MNGALLLALLLAVAACSTGDVVVADIAGSGGTAGAGGAPDGGSCATSGDCGPGEYCAKSSCSDGKGMCDRRPLLCGADGPPACGCDGVTYWNDCLRRQGGASASKPGECEMDARRCGGPMEPCPGAAVCARLVPPMAPCDGMNPGVCWVAPSTCPPPGPGERWQTCDSSVKCLDTCAALHAGGAFRGSPPGTCM